MIPKYKLGDTINFKLSDNSTYTGIIHIVDVNGTYENPDEVSYDIMADGCLYKHVPESIVYESNN